MPPAAQPARRLLLVDDDVAKRYVMATWLRRAGHGVVEAGTGREALASVAGSEIVVLDVNLPDMSGFEVCRAIKSDPATAAIPVVQVSAAAVEVADRAEGLTQGADAYLVNPAEPQELLATVTALLRYFRARQQAERTASLLTRLTSVTLDINAATTFDGLARAAATGAAVIFGGEAVLIVVQPDGQLRRVSASAAQPVPGYRGGPVQMAGQIADLLLGPRETSAAAVVTASDWRALVPDSTLAGDLCVAVARTKPGHPPVILAIDAAAAPGNEEMQVQRQLVLSVALAAQALRSYAQEHFVAMTLQRSFLPSALPAVPGLTMAARYIPASDTAAVGGDFYEALTWGDKLLIAIGDVQGHSLHAATVMGELRHALRAFAAENHHPETISRLVNDVLQRYHPNIVATLCLVLVDPPTGELTLINCGHIPPLIVADGVAQFLGQGGLMLGLPMHDPHTVTAVLPAGGTILLITDGLVEERRLPLDDNLERLRAAAETVSSAPAEAFVNHLMALFGPREDDVAMIALRRTDDARRQVRSAAGDI